MKMLAIDIGSSNIKCGIIEDGVVLESWGEQTANAAKTGKDLNKRASHLPVALCSVVPEATQLLEQSFRKADVRVSAEAQQEIRGFYSGFGADRIADAVAGRILYAEGKNLILIGLGTVTVLTAISAVGSFAGGLITLGLECTGQTLTSRIPQLPVISFDSVETQELGMDTNVSMRNGIFLAHLGALRSWIDCAKQSLSGPAVIVASGGWSNLVSKHSALFDHVDSFLTLKGTYLIASKILQGHALT
jgi:type III pantothenate kinase